MWPDIAHNIDGRISPHIEPKTEKDVQAIERSWALGVDLTDKPHPGQLESDAKSTMSRKEDPEHGEQDASTDTGEFWYSGGDIRYPAPDHGDSWDECKRLLQRVDKHRCDAWKDEVDKLLIFAGLFSAVVTGFTIDAYKWLNPDPSVATAQLVAIIAQQLTNATSPDTAQRSISSVVSGMQNFQPNPYAVRVNILWFLSLSLALATAIIGILCTQWLREYQRDSGLPPMESFAVAQMRREGLERWSVPTILSALPLLLQAALVLFFVGLIDFLFNLNTSVAIVVSVIILTTFLFLAATTVLPALQFLLHGTYHFRVPQCPFKSPQSWAFCRLSFKVCSVLSNLMPEAQFVVSMSDKTAWRHVFERGRLALKFSYWPHFDKFWYSKRMRFQGVGRSHEPDDDFVKGLARLASSHFSNMPVFYHVLQCMRSAPIEANKLGTTLLRLLGNRHNRIFGALQRLSNVQAKDALSLLSLKYLPGLGIRPCPEAIRSHWELAIRINNTVNREDAIIDLMPPVPLEELKDFEIPEDIIYHGFKCIGRLAIAAKDLKHGADDMFMLLISAVAQQSAEDRDASRLDPILGAMFGACQRIERWLQQRRVDDLRASLKCASWVVTAFAAPVVDRKVLDRWEWHAGYEKLMSLLRTMYGISKGVDEDLFPGIPPTDGTVWMSVRKKFGLDSDKIVLLSHVEDVPN